MEAYKSTCPHCNKSYFWSGYKTGIGKTAAQLEQMEKEHTVCKYCNNPGLKTELDHETESGRVQDEMTGIAAGFVLELLGARAKKEVPVESPQPEDIAKPQDVVESPNEVIDGEHNIYIEIRTGIVRQRIMGMKDPNGQDPWVSYILGVSSGNDIRQWNHSLKVHVIREAQRLIGIWKTETEK